MAGQGLTQIGKGLVTGVALFDLPRVLVLGLREDSSGLAVVPSQTGQAHGIAAPLQEQGDIFIPEKNVSNEVGMLSQVVEREILRTGQAWFHGISPRCGLWTLLLSACQVSTVVRYVSINALRAQ